MSSMLYEKIENAITSREEEEGLKKGSFIKIPKSINDNLKHSLRAYQKQALQNFIYYMDTNRTYKSINNKHLLFNMATGSGKTNIIASSILYLYQKGYRNFIFFVNSNNIIMKTIHNLVNNQSSKYLYNQTIKIDNKNININLVNDTFEDSKPNDINIMLTTTHKLHGDLEINIKEGKLTYDYFKDDKVALIADEAHHLNSELKKSKNKRDELNIQSWGTTSQKLLQTNKDNILLEFTATSEIDASEEIREHYIDKKIFNYSFKEFREDGFSKEISLIKSGLDEKFRIIQALMVSEYRLMIAQNKDIDISLKPAILFKTPTTIKDVNNNFDNFINIVNRLDIKDINEVFKVSSVEAIKELESLIDDKKDFISQLKYSFRENVCVKIYSNKEDKQEILELLNTLEDEHNHIRVIFAVNVLNEGWDVLNLFDIVKLDSPKKDKKSTTSEAQLIGRGARYFPFEYQDYDKYKRKFDEKINPFRMLESMYFHSTNNNQYIENLQTTLGENGMTDNPNEKYIFEPKESFKEHYLYTKGVVYVNSRKPIDREEEVKGMKFYTKNTNYKNKPIYYYNDSIETKILEENMFKPADKQEDVLFKNIDKDIIISTINKDIFFYFSNLKQYFPNLSSIDDFINKKEYLGDVSFGFYSIKEVKLNDKHKIDMVAKLLNDLKYMIIQNDRHFEASNVFKPEKIKNKLEPKQLTKKKVELDYEDKEWYVFKKHYGTSEEKYFIDFMVDIMSKLEDNYNDIKLLRNEKSFNLYSMDKKEEAKKFEPDFILLLQDKKESNCYYQVFIEPKGNWAKGGAVDFNKSHEKWKQDLLLKITELTNDNNLTIKPKIEYFGDSCFKIYGMSFYNKDTDDTFINEFNDMFLSIEN